MQKLLCGATILNHSYCETCLDVMLTMKDIIHHCSLWPFSDRHSFHEEDPTGSGGLQCVSWRAGIPEQASGGVCPPFTGGSAQRTG